MFAYTDGAEPLLKSPRFVEILTSFTSHRHPDRVERELHALWVHLSAEPGVCTDDITIVGGLVVPGYAPGVV